MVQCLPGREAILRHVWPASQRTHSCSAHPEGTGTTHLTEYLSWNKGETKKELLDKFLPRKTKFVWKMETVDSLIHEEYLKSVLMRKNEETHSHHHIEMD